LIVSAVKICKQCLQTASASRRPYQGFALDLPRGFPSARPLGNRLPDENSWCRHRWH